MSMERCAWGTAREGEVELYALDNGVLGLGVATYGGIITSLRVPGRGGRAEEVTLGYDTLEGYLADQCNFGCLVGRVANRIKQARFTLNGTTYELDRNHGKHQLHGGRAGFSRRVWQAEAFEDQGCPCLRLELESADGDQGYPGRLRAAVTYTLAGDALRIGYEAQADAPTPVSLTNHAYFNLDGIEPGAPVPSCLEHSLHTPACSVLETDDDLIPTGRVLPVAGTPLDFTEPKAIGKNLSSGFEQSHPLLRAGGGYDHFYPLERGEEHGTKTLMAAAVVQSPLTGRRMEMRTTCDGFQLYTGNFIPEGLRGRAGEMYGLRSALCLEAHGFVDAPNNPSFPQVILEPGQLYAETTEYHFSLAKLGC